jgi:hypothetical protein
LRAAQRRRLRGACGRASCRYCRSCRASESTIYSRADRTCLRVFDSADEALASNEIAANWMRNNVLEFVKGMPEVTAGNVLVAEGKRASGDGRSAA